MFCFFYAESITNTLSDHLIKGSFAVSKDCLPDLACFQIISYSFVLGAGSSASFVSQDEMWTADSRHFHPKLSDNYKVISRLFSPSLES